MTWIPVSDRVVEVEVKNSTDWINFQTPGRFVTLSDDNKTDWNIFLLVFLLQFLSRMRWKFPQLVLTSNGSASCGGSFRSRQGTISSATTTEFANERGSSVTTEETEIQHNTEDTESFTATYYRLRRSRTRWPEDYDQENKLDSMEVTNLTTMCKPFRGRCFIRCSPEKNGSTGLWAHPSSADRPIRGCRPHNNCCERCWNNPETPFCDLCLTSNPLTVNRSATISVQAVIENPPELLVMTQNVWLIVHDFIWMLLL